MFHAAPCCAVPGTRIGEPAARAPRVLIIDDVMSAGTAVRESIALIRAAGLTVRAAMRTKEAVHAELKLDDPALDDAQLLQAMEAHPVLLNRPFVTTSKGTRLCRPIEAVHDIL